MHSANNTTVFIKACKSEPVIIHLLSYDFLKSLIQEGAGERGKINI